MRKITLGKGPASAHAGQGEIIREFTDGYMHGGLLALRVVDDEQRPVRLDVYRTEGQVSVVAAPADIAAGIGESDAAELVRLLIEKFPHLAAVTRAATDEAEIREISALIDGDPWGQNGPTSEVEQVTEDEVVLRIGDGTRDGLLVIADTSWDSNGTLLVTIRERIGGGDAGWIGGMPIERMRRLARRALSHPERTRSSRVVEKRIGHDGCGYVKFAVSRLP